MNIEDKLYQEKLRLTRHTVDKEKFLQSFWARADESEKRSRFPWQRKRLALTAGAIAVVLIGGLSFSPVIANALQQVPVVHVVLNWARGAGDAKYVRNVQQSATDNGITMTITDVLYGPSQLSFGYTVSPRQPGVPRGDVVAIGPPNGMEFFVNGKRVHLQTIGGGKPTPYGFKGMVTLTDSGTTTTLPSAFHFKIILHKIGHTRGTWKFTVPVSQKNMKPNQTFLPMVTKQVGNEVFTIKEVQLYPTGGKIDYSISAPAGEATPVSLTLYDQHKNLLDTVFAQPSAAQSHSRAGHTETWSYSQSFRLQGHQPTSLIVRPMAMGTKTEKTVPVTGPFPVVMNNGIFGKVTITGVTVRGKVVKVHYKQTGESQTRPGLHFSIQDKSNSRAYGAVLGQKSGPANSHQYVDVYTFPKNVSGDKLVLQLPPPVQNVFTVPLRKH